MESKSGESSISTPISTVFSLLQAKESRRKIMFPREDVTQERSAPVSNNTSNISSFIGGGRGRGGHLVARGGQTNGRGHRSGEIDRR